MRSRWLFQMGVFLLAGCFGSPQANDSSFVVTIYVAASTRVPVEQIAAAFESETGTRVLVQPGASSMLAKQIQQGGPADLFLSADEASADFLAAKELVAERVDLLTNRLVVIVPATASRLSIKQLRDLADPAVKKLALAEPGVPAGEYGRAALRFARILEDVKPRLVGAIDVSATLQLVARGEVDAGIVYATDARNNSKVRIALEIDPKAHPPIRYPLLLLRPRPDTAARRLYKFMSSEKAAALFRQAGFGVVQ
jgi:molybdate transport system substrate-binding protein